MPLQHGREAALGYHGNSIASGPQRLKSGRGEHEIAQGAEANQQNFRPWRAQNSRAFPPKRLQSKKSQRENLVEITKFSFLNFLIVRKCFV
jgi:hypothetical protein